MGSLPIQLIHRETLKQWRHTAIPLQLIDVRSATEFATAHIPGAANIPLEQVELRIADLAAERPIVLVCQAGTRARIAAGTLASSGLEARVLEGGTEAWIKAGEPVVCLTRTRWAMERQVRFVAGILVALGTLLAATVSNWFLILPAFIGCGLTFAGLSGLCPMGEMLARMPWNRSRPSASTDHDRKQGVSCSCELPK